MRGYWSWGWATKLDCPVIGLPFGVWWGNEWGTGYTVSFIVGPWYVSYRFFKDSE